MKMLAKRLSNLAIIVSALGCKQSATNAGPQIPPSLEQVTPRDGRFEDLVMLQERRVLDEELHLSRRIRIDYNRRRAMISYSTDQRRGDVIIYIANESPNEQSTYLSAITDKKNISKLLGRQAIEGKDATLFLKEEKAFNEEYDSWVRGAHK